MEAYKNIKLLLISLLLSIALNQLANASEVKPLQYSKKGADSCLKCHDEDNDYPILPLFKTKHGERHDSRTPMAKLQCETCHGAIGDHKKTAKKGEKKSPIRAFGSKAWTPVAEQNQVCLNCHNNTARNNWFGGIHESESLSCADCHTIHVRRDPMLVARTQVKKCTSCHLKQKAEFNRRSAHPVRFSKMRCSDCHNPHGTVSDKLIKTGTKNQLCYRCHAEKRGPLLWAHAPVSEDCTVCHNPHGSMHPSLLKKRPPLLCQQCHGSAGHPSALYSGAGLPSGSSTTQRKFLLGRSCLNCHSQIHGSNHPSGVKLLR